MDKSRFINTLPGKLVSVNDGGAPDWAFVPDPIPETWRVPEDVWPLLAEAREELARLDGIGRHMPHHDLLLKPLQRREALKSSSLEGTYATPEQLLLFELAPRDTNDPWREVDNYTKALNRGLELLKDLPLSLRVIRELHEILMCGVRGGQTAPGAFRTTQVHIGSDRRFMPPPHQEALTCLYDLEKRWNTDTAIDPLVFCCMAHYQFEAIHPFRDGNGRIGRLVLALMIHRWCGLAHPWLYLSAYFDTHRDEYIDTLFNVSAQGDWHGWIVFCLRAVIHQARDSIRRCDTILALKDQYLSKVSVCGGTMKIIEVVNMLFDLPVTTIPIVAGQMTVSYPTAKSYIDVLRRCDIVMPAPTRARPRVFLAPGIIKTAYSDHS